MMPHSTTYQRILLIEDNDIDVELVKRITRRLGLDLPITRARNGLEALKLLNEAESDVLNKPYIILLDINMPLMSGFELLDHLSTNGPDIEMPIYILSTSEAESDLSKAKSFSVNGYLIKPLSKESLSHVLIDKAA